MKDKYNLTREQNVFLAKKVMTSSVYNAAKLEGLNTTYVQTEKILNGINDGNVSLDDVRVILNLKSAWKYILDNLDKDLDVDFICNVNKRVSANESLDWGVIRYGKVGVRLCDGKRFEPEIPRIEEVEKKLSEIKKLLKLEKGGNMKINEKLEITFPVNNKYLKKDINILERIFKRYNKLNKEKKQGDIGNLYERIFYNYVRQIESDALAEIRAKKITEEQFMILTNRYEEF